MGSVRFKFMNNQCDLGAEQSECALAMINKSSCIGMYFVAVALHQSQRDPFSEVSMWSLIIIRQCSFIAIQVLIKMLGDL